MTQPPPAPRDPFNVPESPDPPVEQQPTLSQPAAAPDASSPTVEASGHLQPTQLKVPFELQDDEKVIKVARRHWAFLTVHLVKDLLFALLPIIALAIIIQLASGFDGTVGRIAIAAMVVWAAFWLIRGYFDWYRYQNDQWVLTNQRIVDSQRNNWFHHRLSSADLVNVEDMSIQKAGIFPTVFNYGDLLAQTAGAREKFVLSGIPEPASVLALVDRYRDAAKRELIRGNIL